MISPSYDITRVAPSDKPPILTFLLRDIRGWCRCPGFFQPLYHFLCDRHYVGVSELQASYLGRSCPFAQLRGVLVTTFLLVAHGR